MSSATRPPAVSQTPAVVIWDKEVDFTSKFKLGRELGKGKFAAKDGTRALIPALAKLFGCALILFDLDFSMSFLLPSLLLLLLLFSHPPPPSSRTKAPTASSSTAPASPMANPAPSSASRRPASPPTPPRSTTPGGRGRSSLWSRRARASRLCSPWPRTGTTPTTSPSSAAAGSSSTPWWPAAPGSARPTPRRASRRWCGLWTTCTSWA